MVDIRSHYLTYFKPSISKIYLSFFTYICLSLFLFIILKFDKVYPYFLAYFLMDILKNLLPEKYNKAYGNSFLLANIISIDIGYFFY